MNKSIRCKNKEDQLPPVQPSRHRWDIELRHRRSCFFQGLMWSMSAESGERMRMLDGERSDLTLLISNVSHRCCAPSSPIPLPCRSSEMSAYREWMWSSDDRWKELLSYSIDLQPVCKIFDSSRSSLIPTKIHCLQCLVNRKEVNSLVHPMENCLTWLIFKASARRWTPSLSISLKFRSSVVSVYRVSVDWLDSLIRPQSILPDCSSIDHSDTELHRFQDCSSTVQV
jgi:hypothetical protein